jgi:redox-sensitive bicupin YhaK (pirin superfamily)
MGVDIRRARDRLRTEVDWLDSWHSFSFGDHYDPQNTHFGVLLVNNDDTVRPSGGFATHAHQDMEIVTWVLSGALEHWDSAGHRGVIAPGLAQRMTAGRGVQHSEQNGGGSDVRFVQMWVPPDETGLEPSYAQAELADSELAGRFAVVASGMAKHRHEAAVRIASSHAALHVARLSPGEAVVLPDAPFTHLFVAKGAVELEGCGDLAAADAARLTAAGARRATAVDSAEILMWEMDIDIRALR